MKTNVPAALVTFLDNLCQSGTGGAYVVVDLYQFVLLSGTVLRLTNWTVPVTYLGNTYSAAGPYISRSQVKQSLKLEVSQIKVTLSAAPTMMIGSMSVLAAIAQGLFSGASVTVYRLIGQTAMPLDMSLGAVIWFVGQVAEVEELGRSHAVLTIKDPTALLSSPHPRNLLQPGCRHTLFDAGCKLNAASFLVTGAVTSGSNAQTVNTNLNTTTYPGPLTAPAAAPTLSTVSGGTGVNLPALTYYVVVTYTGAMGESFASPESNFAVSGGGQNGTTDNLLKIASPPAFSGATGWNVYVGTDAGDEQLQNSPPIAIGTPWMENGSGITQGVAPPFQQSSGWFTLGVVTFTSGVNAGLSRGVSQYSASGALTLLPPLPNPPSTGDTFTILPGCELTQTVCGSAKFNNIANYSGIDFAPSPEQSV